MKNLKDKMTATRLQGVKDFLTDGIMLGELDSNTTVAELLSKVSQMLDDKNSKYKKKLRNIQEEGNEDDLFR